MGNVPHLQGDKHASLAPWSVNRTQRGFYLRRKEPTCHPGLIPMAHLRGGNLKSGAVLPTQPLPSRKGLCSWRGEVSCFRPIKSHFIITRHGLLNLNLLKCTAEISWQHILNERRRFKAFSVRPFPGKQRPGCLHRRHLENVRWDSWLHFGGAHMFCIFSFQKCCFYNRFLSSSFLSVSEAVTESQKYSGQT